MLHFPTTFDSSMPATALFGERPPVLIGEKYCFEGAGPSGEDITGAVVDVTVVETWKAAMVIVKTDDGKNLILKEPLSEAQLADYKNHPEPNWPISGCPKPREESVDRRYKRGGWSINRLISLKSWPCFFPSSTHFKSKICALAM